MRIKKYAVFLIWGFCIMGFTPVPPQNGQATAKQDFQVKAQHLINKTFEHYQHFSRAYFSGIISKDFTPNDIDFISSVENGFNKGKILEMNYFIDEVIPEGNKLSISFKWQKKVQYNNAKGVSLIEGNAQFVFSKEHGKWHLSQVDGDSPF